MGKSFQKGRTANAVALERVFAQEYVKNGMNGTKAYKAIRPHVTNESARSTAPTLLAKASVQKGILELLPSDDVEAGVIREALSAGRKDKSIEWRDIHKFLETSLKLKGYLQDKQQKSSLNIAIISKS